MTVPRNGIKQSLTADLSTDLDPAISGDNVVFVSNQLGSSEILIGGWV
jgi:hypothetical protein